ncbi:unnamed protein product [Absidia cylindrospora]
MTHTATVISTLQTTNNSYWNSFVMGQLPYSSWISGQSFVKSKMQVYSASMVAAIANSKNYVISFDRSLVSFVHLSCMLPDLSPSCHQYLIYRRHLLDTNIY